jgi:hypothetical protein
MKADRHPKGSDIRNLPEVAEEAQEEVALNPSMANACGFAWVHCMFPSTPFQRHTKSG